MSYNIVKPCAVYLVRAIGIGLVYVGISEDFDRRWDQHRRRSWWLREVIVDQVDVHWMPSREAASQVEAAVIDLCRPQFNSATELAALGRYRAAAASGVEDPWPIVRSEICDAEGGVVWSEF